MGEAKMGGAESGWTYSMYLYISPTGRVPLLLAFKAIPIRTVYEQLGFWWGLATEGQSLWDGVCWPGAWTVRRMGVARTVVGCVPGWPSAADVKMFCVPGRQGLYSDGPWFDFCIVRRLQIASEIKEWNESGITKISLFMAAKNTRIYTRATCCLDN